ncbi:centrosome and spindle pole-associated protein 1-like [Sinocyclocheilus rhinocerous]|uniref:centrosome and spindle pole-associated protein 1-like n=1 Tax=Sinocyclocheilus rhinocerous TaxID=307959 RepID=UPI0007B97D02|nr:PREDICTED: centrosome and spindle pole-associated protein 1-like [Sinocyclocheilus rhinocerous]
MDELLGKFLEDQKTKIAEEKACLEQDPPYMEMRRRTGHVLQKEDIPPRTSQQDGVSLPLGEEYERKKHKLQEELRNDYRKYMAEKDHWDAGDIHTVPERRRIPRTVRVRDVATLTEVCGLGWGVCSSEEDCSDEELMLLQGRRHQRERDTRTANRRGELYTETGHHTSKLQHRNRGRGGAGAPLRDSTGNLITDLKKMHLLNAAAAAPPQRPERPGFVETHTPRFARGNVFNQMLSPQQLLEQDQYKAYLRLQIEDKQRKQAEERKWMRAEEEREDRRLAEQREKIRREYEEEQESRKRREMKQKLKNEELARLVEERRRDAEKKKEEEEKERAAVREQEEQERQIRLQQVQRAPSPPIPTLQKKHRNPSNATVTKTDFSAFRALPSPENRNNQRTESKHSSLCTHIMMEMSYWLFCFYILIKKESHTVWEQYDGAVDLEAALQRKKERYRCELQEQIAEKQSHRRSFLSSVEHKRDNRQNVHAALMNYSCNSTFFREKELDLRVPTDAEKKQLFVSEASAYRKQPRDDIIRLDTAEPAEGVLQYRTDPLSPCRMPFVPTHLPFLTDAYKTPNNDSESLMSPSRAYYPITGVSFSTSSGEPHSLSTHSRSTHRQHRTDVFDMARLRMPVRGPSARGTEPISLKGADDIMYRDAFMPRTWQSRDRDVEGGRGSVLLSESEFIDQNGVAFPVPPDSERKSAKLSARERRRLANLRSAEGKPVQLQSFNMRKLRDTNTPRMKRLQAFGHHNTTAGVCSDDDDEASRGDEHFTLQSPGRPSSIDTATTEPWIRAETSDTLRRLMSGSEL